MALSSVRSLPTLMSFSLILGDGTPKLYAVPDHLVRICVGAIFAQKFKLGDKLLESRVALDFVVKLITGEHGV